MPIVEVMGVEASHIVGIIIASSVGHLGRNVVDVSHRPAVHIWIVKH